jgi:uncharacterized membrane protein (DUF485 family)
MQKKNSLESKRQNFIIKFSIIITIVFFIIVILLANLISSPYLLNEFRMELGYIIFIPPIIFAFIISVIATLKNKSSYKSMIFDFILSLFIIAILLLFLVIIGGNLCFFGCFSS